MSETEPVACGGESPAVRRSRAGMSVVELMIVVTIIGFLAVLAVPQFRLSRQRSQNAAFANDLRLLAGEVFELYAFSHGDYPPGADPGVAPEGVESLLPKRFDWTRRTPIGGYWKWDRAPAPGAQVYELAYAGLKVHQPARTVAEMRSIDATLDDGDLDTGFFRIVEDGYFYVLKF